jgi:uncharacterized protein YuzE
MSRPTAHYDPQSDVLYFLVREGEEERFVEVTERVNVELDQEGQLLGVEILNASRFLRATIGPSAMLRTSPERLARLARLEAKPGRTQPNLCQRGVFMPYITRDFPIEFVNTIVHKEVQGKKPIYGPHR